VVKFIYPLANSLHIIKTVRIAHPQALEAIG
jgi:hypothetical protein